ncbi:aspartate aminotransferase, cytoplasmic-like isoform X2 [Rhinatrema bivittatum]|nr:aspartate aminotransferase, cytoplasmic-like isoform X2 [Rhinatrema bivittatum]
MGAAFLQHWYGRGLRSPIYLSSPSYEEHSLMFAFWGFEDVRCYRYWDAATKGVSMPEMLEDLRAAPERSVVVLQACAHFPTGADPTPEQWELIAEVMKVRSLFPFFDLSMQGLSSGDLEADAWPVRYFESQGFEFFCAQTFSTAFGLHDELVGSLTIVVKDQEVLQHVSSHMAHIARTLWSKPPIRGGYIIAALFQDTDTAAACKEDLRTMVTKLRSIREMLVNLLITLKTPGCWEYLLRQTGIYTYLELTSQQAEFLRKKKLIPLTSEGAIKICDLTAQSTIFLAEALIEAVTS